MLFEKWTPRSMLNVCYKGQPGHPEKMHQKREGCYTCGCCDVVQGKIKVWCNRKREMVWPDELCDDTDSSMDWSRIATYIKLTPEVFRDMLNLEHGDGREYVGLIGSSDKWMIDRFAEDRQCTAEPNECRLSEEACSIFREWKHDKVRFAGLIHTHPAGWNRLSASDIAYAREMMRLNGMTCMFMGVLTREGVFMYLVDADGKVETLEYAIF